MIVRLQSDPQSLPAESIAITVNVSALARLKKEKDASGLINHGGLPQCILSHWHRPCEEMVRAPLAAISEHRLQQRHGLLTAAYNKEEEEEEEEEEEFTETSQFKGKRLIRDSKAAENCRVGECETLRGEARLLGLFHFSQVFTGDTTHTKKIISSLLIRG